MSSARINITNYYTCGRSYGIDRTMPAIMAGRMSEYEWDLFCDQVDTILAPLNKLRCILGAGTAATFIGFILVMVVSIMNAQSSFNSNSFDDSGPSPFVFFLVPLGLMVGLIALSCWASMKARGAFSEIVQVCEKTSRSNPKVSLHLRDDRIVAGGYYSGTGSGYRTYHNVYIVASLADINVVSVGSDANRVAPSLTRDLEAGSPDPYIAQNIPVAEVIEPTITDSAEEDDAVSLSVKKRMKKLNKIKALLTTEEYERKRDEILADI